MDNITFSHPEIIKKWHPTKNINISPENFTFGSHKKVWWLCDKKCSEGCLHEWEAMIKDRCGKNSGCPYCTKMKGNRKFCIHESLSVTHPEIAKQWHPTKNGELKPEMISFGSNIKVWWLCDKTCPEGCKHEWKTEPNKRTDGINCIFCCHNPKNLCEHTSIKFTHPEISKQWHPTKNGELKQEMFSSGSDKKIWWLCDKTCSEGCLHEWETSITQRCSESNPRNCPFCSKPCKQICLHDSIIYKYPDIAKKLDPDKNKDVDFTTISVGSSKKFWWICNNNHMIQDTIKSKITHPESCPLCLYKTQEKLYNFLLQEYKNIIREFKPKWSKSESTNRDLPFDFYIPELNCIIELDGIQHFEQVKIWKNKDITFKNDIYKMKKCLENNISVIRILQEDVWNNSIKWLEDKLIPFIKNYDSSNIIYLDNEYNFYNNHKLAMEI